MRKVATFGKLVLLTTLMTGLFACAGGDTDGGKAGDETFDGTQYVPTDDSAGSISVSVDEDEIPISQISGFTVEVRDANNAPVPGLNITCDSEEGVAIVEPTQGHEITDGFGRISGKIGCYLPGSFQFGCRLPVGGNKRKLLRIKCTGDTPTGFAGFPGSAGGTLGGGVDNSDDGGPGGTDTDGVRITRVIAEEAVDGSDTVQVDVNQVIDCDGDATTSDPEPFSDTFLKVTAVNNTNSQVRFERLTYSVPNYDGTGRTFQSSGIALIGETSAAPNGGQVEVQVLAFSVIGSGSADKYFVNTSTGNAGISTSLGFRNISVTLTGTTAVGQRVEATGTVVLSFAGYNHCG